LVKLAHAEAHAAKAPPTRQKDSAFGPQRSAPAAASDNAGRVGHRRPARHISGGMAQIRFRKMHGLGNDFVVLDQRREAMAIDAETARHIADRHTGIGCDQLLLIEPPRHPSAQVAMRILNADGSEAEACATGPAASPPRRRGNRRQPGAHRDGGRAARSGTAADDNVAVDMGRRAPAGMTSRWLARWTPAGRSGAWTVAGAGLHQCRQPARHLFVADAEAIDLAALGPRLEHDALFPERANIGVAACSIAGGSVSGYGSAAPALPRLRHRRLRRAGRGAPPRTDRTAGNCRLDAGRSTFAGATTGT